MQIDRLAVNGYRNPDRWASRIAAAKAIDAAALPPDGWSEPVPSRRLELTSAADLHSARLAMRDVLRAAMKSAPALGDKIRR